MVNYIREELVMPDVTVTITLYGDGSFTYDRGYQIVHPGQTVRFVCNRPFTVKFNHGTPFCPNSIYPGPPTEFYQGHDTGQICDAEHVERKVYHYLVTAIGDDSRPHLDGGCP